MLGSRLLPQLLFWTLGPLRERLGLWDQRDMDLELRSGTYSSEILSKLLGLSVTWIFLFVCFTCKMRIIISSLGILKDCNTQ